MTRLDSTLKENLMMSRLLSNDLTPAIRRAQLSLLAAAYSRWLTKYRPDQARVPAGSRQGGQWTAEGGQGDLGAGTGSTQDGSVPSNNQNTGSVDVSVEGNDAEQYSAGPFDIEFVGSRTSVTIDYSRALTGISTIDDTTKKLSETLGDTMARVEFIAEWTPSMYGTAVHVDFATRVKLQGIRGVEVEQSFSSEDFTRYGAAGSIRTDVVLRNDVGDIIAIYDIKTGGAGLRSARVQEIRNLTKVGIEVPVIELQVNRGGTIKSNRVRMRNIGRVTAFLWNPVHRDIAGRAAGA